jgi:hypothetical protein
LIATAIPAVGTMNEVKEGQNAPAFVKNQEVVKGNVRPLHDLVVDWDHIYGGPNIEVFRGVKQTEDGGYIAVGAWNATNTPGLSGSHWLVKVDANGDEEWNASALPNASFYPRCYNVEQTSDGGYVTAGCHSDGTWGYNRCIWKVDEDGNTEWLKVYDDPLYGYHTCIQETEDGGYIVAGEYDISLQDWDVLLMKTNSTGAVEWQKIYRYGAYADNARAVRQTSDGGYILCGRSATGAAFSTSDLLVIKTDSNGDEEWHNTYGGEDVEWTQASDILIADDGYYFLGETDSFGAGGRDVWLIKTDADGNEEWNKTFGDINNEMCGGMDFTEDDDGIILTGTLNAFHWEPPHSEGAVIKTDLDGVLEWAHIFGDELYDELQSVCVTSDGDYVVAGDLDSTGTSGFGLVDSWLIKIKAFENNPPDKPDKPSGKKKVNAGVVYTYTSKSSDIDGDQIYYKWNWGDDNESEWLGPYNSGEICEAEKFWEEGGKYNVKVMARDEHYADSEWSEGLSFSIPRNKAFNFNFNLLEWLFERFPNAFPILRHLLGV